MKGEEIKAIFPCSFGDSLFIFLAIFIKKLNKNISSSLQVNSDRK
jgi:hypothetical protein